MFNYFSPMDPESHGGVFPEGSPEPGEPLAFDGPLPYGEIDESATNEPIIKISDMGQSVPEGQRFGNFVQTTQQAIRRGAGTLELSTGMGGGGEAVGAESYGTEARREIKEIAKVSGTKLISIHTPVNIGNMSGYNPQERSFNDEYRKVEMEEVKRAVDFASDVTEGGAVVVHTGEFQRDMSQEKWAVDEKGNYQFLTYDEEPGRATVYMVDDRTGRVITEVKKTQKVYEPVFLRDSVTNKWVDWNGHLINEDDPTELLGRVPILEGQKEHINVRNQREFLDFKGNVEYDPNKARFKVQELTWDDFQKRAQEHNKEHGYDESNMTTAEKEFFKTQLYTQIAQAKGGALYYMQSYESQVQAREKIKDAIDFYEKLWNETPEKDRWKLMQTEGHRHSSLIPPDTKDPVSLLRENLRDIERHLLHSHEASSAYESQAAQSMDTLKHVVPVKEYGIKQTTRSYAEAGIYAFEKTKEKGLDKPIFIAPENLWPEMGWGTHPEELIDLVEKSRDTMAQMLTSKKIEDPHRRLDRDGKPIMVDNPYYRKDLNYSEAERLAKDHIKATLDTQHLSMWWKHFQSKPGESEEQKLDRFNRWYMDQIKKLNEKGIIGHVHIVDAMGGGHQHLPAGQGIFPVVSAVEYMKKHGFKGTTISEGHGESHYGEDRILTQAWRAFGNPIYRTGFSPGSFGSGGGGGQRWTDIRQSYFGQNQSPYFIFGAYAPSNDWTLWSQVPME